MTKHDQAHVDSPNDSTQPDTASSGVPVSTTVEAIATFVEGLRAEYISQLMSVRSVAGLIREHFIADPIADALPRCAQHDEPLDYTCGQCLESQFDAMALEIKNLQLQLAETATELRQERRR